MAGGLRSGERWAGGRSGGWGVDSAERTQSTRFLHTSGRSDPLGQGRFCRTNPTRIGPHRFGSTTGAGGRSALRNEPNPGSGSHPVGGRFCRTNPIFITRSGFPPDCQPGPEWEVTRSASVVLGLPFPVTSCHHPGSRRSAGRFCRTNPIPGDVLPRVGATGPGVDSTERTQIGRAEPIRGRECRHRSGDRCHQGRTRSLASPTGYAHSNRPELPPG
ncbi:MAG: hypothetical protein JWO38_3859 [Gemmataceae bacterium]|nr:hypothetical protein [Gemmataceae bacterium]